MDPYVKQWLKNMVKTYVMVDPKMIKAFPVVAMKNPAMAKQMVLNSVRTEGFNTIFKKYGPIASIMFHEGGPLGLGTSGPMGMGIQQSMMRDPLATWGKLRFAMAFPGVTGIGYLFNKLFPSGGEKGGLTTTFGPRLADAASKLTEWGPRGGILSTQDWLSSGGGTGPMGGTFLPRAAGWASRVGMDLTPAQRGTGIFGGKAGPWLADLFGFDPITKGSSGRGGNYQASTAGSGSTYWDPVNQMYIDKSTGKEYVDTRTGYIPQGAQIDLSTQYGGKK